MNVRLGKSSQEKLASVDKRLQSVVVKAFEVMPFDVMVLEGIRTKERQKELVAKGASKTMNSKHLTGRAIDLAPYPIDWNDKARFNKMAGVVLAAAKELGINVRWGGDWDQDGDWKDERFYDGPHFELMD
ncbi:MAG: M15 family metallopeptidase [Hafnia sp.]